MESSSSSSSSAAARWAESIDLKTVDPVDRPYLRAIFVAALEIQEPKPSLSVAIVNSGTADFIRVTFRGYKMPLNDIKWVNTFLGRDRDAMFSQIVDSFTQLDSQGECVKVLHVQRMNFDKGEQHKVERHRGRATIKRQFH